VGDLTNRLSVILIDTYSNAAVYFFYALRCDIDKSIPGVKRQLQIHYTTFIGSECLLVQLIVNSFDLPQYTVLGRFHPFTGHEGP